MSKRDWRSEAANDSLKRLLPRIEKTYKKELTDTQVQWGHFKHRLNREWEPE